METNFKYKVGDIVKITSDWWSTCTRPNTYICVIVGQRLLDGKIIHGGIEGQKYGYYDAQYTFDGFDHVAQKSVDADIELLSEYWYINDSFEICKETNVELSSQFIHRAYGFGVFLTREDASRAIYNKKHARYSNMNNLLKMIKKCETAPTIELVDLGLPSGTKWMKYNIGATSETEYGKFFQWGDTVGYEDASHSTWATAPFNNGSSDYDADAFASVKDTVCPNGVLAPQYDAAYKTTNGVAHMPTQADFEELTANTTVEWITNFNGSGVNGGKFTSKKDTSKYIFIPASGYAYCNVFGRGSLGYVWSSSLNADYTRRAWYLYFDSDNIGVEYDRRFAGFAVRGVVSK